MSAKHSIDALGLPKTKDEALKSPLNEPGKGAVGQEEERQRMAERRSQQRENSPFNEDAHYLDALQNWDKSREIDVEALKELHKIVVDRIEGDAKPVGGEFRKQDIYLVKRGPGNATQVVFTPVPHAYVPLRMEEFCQTVNAAIEIARKRKLYDSDVPALAAWCHYHLVAIHPWADCNGRTSRLAMNLIFTYFGMPPLILPESARGRYYDALKKANDYDVMSFVEMMVIEYAKQKK